MKSLVLGLFWLLCTASTAWAEDDFEQLLEDEEPPEPILNIFSYNNSVYGMSTYAKLDWFEAQLVCAANGFKLASIPSETVQDRIINFIHAADDSLISYLATERLWISGTNLGDINQYVWQSTGARLGYRNFEGQVRGGYRCVTLNGVTGDWTAEDCRERRHFLCEIACE
ncbi:uncharacterized protein [Drosophila virilis]|uniref:C-type lectin domain-containing protein n=1 Tax=Drosophila virilis TaxID=7244 RepID=B4LIL5_DROVI|nr:regenerating islet-derived protein 4 [Drosophila virilis]EDW60385.1 uncharacterized protein Dvir_GJ21449 [Drosophila virilis]